MLEQDPSLRSPPRTLQEALSRPDREHWIEAIRKEFAGLESKHTFAEVPEIPFGHYPVGSRLIFDIKFNLDQSVLKYKVRLVAQGFSQRAGVDYNETYSPVVHTVSVRIVLALAAELNLELHQLDVEQAFLNGRLDEEIYMRLPKGLKELGIGVADFVRLLGSLYGLKQASRDLRDRQVGLMLRVSIAGVYRPTPLSRLVCGAVSTTLRAPVLQEVGRSETQSRFPPS